MALHLANGMSFSIASNHLICQVEKDIDQYGGNTRVCAVMNSFMEIWYVTGYFYPKGPEYCLSKKRLNTTNRVQICTLTGLLELLRLQNEPMS